VNLPFNTWSKKSSANARPLATLLQTTNRATEPLSAEAIEGVPCLRWLFFCGGGTTEATVDTEDTEHRASVSSVHFIAPVVPAGFDIAQPCDCHAASGVDLP
jgi:hypothetical protein